MKTARITCLCLAFLAAAGCQSPQPQPGASASVTLKIVHGPELRSYLSSMREQFYLTQPVLSDGSLVRISLISEMGVSAAKRIASGEFKNDAWLAPSSSLVDFTNSTLVNLGSKHAHCLKLFETPVVVVIKAEQEALLGVDSQRRFSWSRIMQSALRQRGETAPFVVGFTHAQPRTSTTGLASLIQLAYMTSQKAGLTLQDVSSPQVMEALKAFESLVYSYPLSESYLLNNIMLSSNRQVRVGLTSEQQFRQFKRQNPQVARSLLTLFPEEGSYVEDYQLCTSAADWVTPAHQAALRMFYDFMSSPAAQQAAQELGFRAPRAEETAAPESLVPDFDQTVFLPAVPGAAVSHLLKSWPELRRRAALVLVLDGSGSMEGDSLLAGKEQFRKLIAQTSPNDLKALLAFASNVRILSKFTSDAPQVIRALDIIQAVGGSAVYDAIKKAYEMASDPGLADYRKTIVVFTDGDDKNSEISLFSLIGLAQKKSAEMDTNLIIVAVNLGGANFSDLERVAQAANGTLRIAGLHDMELVFQEIAKSF